ncbi:hypothetical protein WR25_23754 [Diploscapter pachys]|uniref:Homeobox domain-containing protein n=1 Tax=Diploscapter pachys TaxID=2018661 RepID=A0A2A2JFR4_9BILA|nr:hypothetical protein WR25_23754 [Diploscapter pachys]
MIAISAYIYALYHSESFDRLFDIIAQGKFHERYYKDLQDIWYKARYKENEMKRGKELGAVEKYRLRRKYPPPSSIWDGQETVYSFKETSRKYLKQYYLQNQYPTMEQKRDISRVTGLEITQISNWFKNRRQRAKSVIPSNGNGNSCQMNSNISLNLQRIQQLHLQAAYR